MLKSLHLVICSYILKFQPACLKHMYHIMQIEDSHKIHDKNDVQDFSSLLVISLFSKGHMNHGT